MTIFFRCSACGGEHPSRLRAPRSWFFHEVVARLGEVVEQCPTTMAWVTVTYTDMKWMGEELSGSGWV